MKAMNELKLKLCGEDKVIYFGIPDTIEEVNEVYKLRYKVYSSRDYIDPNLFPDEMEKDEYDINRKCDHFIAKIDNKIIGTIRVIKDYFLPTEKICFRFNEPEEIRKIPRDQRAELSRLIAIPYKDKNYLPRNIVMLFLITSLVEYGLENNIFGGYAFIKDSLRVKLQKLRIPIHLINDYFQIYPKSGVLYKYFNDSNNKVMPIYFITKEFKQYLDKIINNSLMFEKADGQKFILKENLYNKFLRFFKII